MATAGAYICEAIRSPIGRYAGVLSGIRPDDLAASVLRALIGRTPHLDLEAIDDVILGCANQAGEDNRNIARMSGLLAGLPVTVSGTTINRLCGSGLDAVAVAARAVASREADLLIAGGVESMSRAPFAIAKSDAAFSRSIEAYDTTIGWRFVNPAMKSAHGVDSMPETAENVASDFGITREAQDEFALRSQARAASAIGRGLFEAEIAPITVSGKKGAVVVATDEHPRSTTLEGLKKLRPIVHPGGTVTAGNSSGVNDGAAALIIASEIAVSQHKLTPKARIVGAATAGVQPRIMGIGPVPATKKLLARHSLSVSGVDIFEVNEAFAAQAIAVLNELGIPADAANVNPNGGAIALGHPLGMSGARLVTTALYELERRSARRALCTMCIGVGQGIAMLIERL